MRCLLPLLFLFFLPACEYTHPNNEYHDRPGDSATWRRFYYNGFALRTPGDWVRYSYDGDRGNISGLSNGADTLEVDDDWHGAAIVGEYSPTRLFAGTTIDGFQSIIAIPTVEGQGDCELQLYLSDYYIFRMTGHVRNTRTALNIFRSVTFDDGHPALTDSLAMDRFSRVYPKSAFVVFDERCKTCHSRRFFNIGPPLEPDFLRYRSNDWIFRFLTARKKVVPDSLSRALGEQWKGFECAEQPDLRRDDFDRLMSWLRMPPSPVPAMPAASK